MTLPSISVNIPLLIGGDCSVVCNSLKKIDYPKSLFEIIIITGNHIAKQRNKGLKHSSGEIVYLMDDDSQIQPDAFKLLAKEFSDPKVAVVGGPSLTPQNNNYLNTLIGYVLETYFGAFRMKSKWSCQADNKMPIDYYFIGANLALRKKTVMAVGGFDEKVVPNEETELVRRLQRNGYKLKYSSKLFIYRNQRTNLYRLFQQFHHYGIGRMKQILKIPYWQDIFLTAPIFFGFYLFSLIFYHPFWYFIPLFLYMILGIATSSKALVKYKKPSLFFCMPLIFPIIHLSYAMGLLHELLLTILSGRYLSDEKKPKFVFEIYYLKKFKSEK